MCKHSQAMEVQVLKSMTPRGRVGLKLWLEFLHRIILNNVKKNLLKKYSTGKA